MLKGCRCLAISSQQALPWPTVILKKGKSRLFKDGQPLIYGGAVDRTVGGTPLSADCVQVHDHALEPIGWGFWNPASMYRVRLMQLARDMPDRLSAELPQQILHSRIGEAIALRVLLGLPNDQTTAYRLINSEGDGALSGLIVDVLGDTLVVASSAAWVERYRAEIGACLRELTGLQHVVWKQSAAMLAEEGVPLSPGVSQGTVQRRVVLLENGVRYAAALGAGQKTGFFCDQRDSRLLVRGLAKGLRVLDLCSYTGGFALSAALGGAEQVVEGLRVLDLCSYTGGFALSAALGGAEQVIGVETSSEAIGLAEENARLNGVQDRVSFCRQDVAEYMREARSEGKLWDLVVLDPPKLAPNKKALERASGKYKRLNAAAMAVTRPGGLLMTCSCSGAVTQGTGLLPILQDAAQQARRRVTVVREAGAAPCHPVSPAYPEGKYLTNVLLCVH